LNGCVREVEALKIPHFAKACLWRTYMKVVFSGRAREPEVAINGLHAEAPWPLNSLYSEKAVSRWWLDALAVEGVRARMVCPERRADKFFILYHAHKIYS